MEKIESAAIEAKEPENVALNPDQRAVMARELREQISAYAMLLGVLEKGQSLPRELTRNVLYLGESRNAELCQISGIELDGAKEQNERYANIRKANARCHELELQLGQGGSAAQTQAHLKLLGDKLNAWWDRTGFGHIREITFSPHGSVNVDFSCNLFGDFVLTNSSTPVSDKERRTAWLSSLEGRGFALVTIRHERDPSLLDCDQNRVVLQELFTKAFPGCTMVETTNHRGANGPAVLRGARVIIRDLEPLDALTLNDEANR